MPSDCARDPVCNKWARQRGDEDGEGVEVDESTDATSEREGRLLRLKGIANGLSARNQLSPDNPGYLTDVEAMAQLFDEGTLLYLDYYGSMEDHDAFILDIGVVVGGIEARGSGFEHARSFFLEGDFAMEDAFRLIRAGDPDDPFGQFYIGYDNFRRSDDRTGFRQDIDQPGENQVRHFVGGLVVAHSFLGAGKQRVLGQETEDYDYAMYQEAFLFHDMMMLHGIHSGTGNYIRYYLAEH